MSISPIGNSLGAISVPYSSGVESQATTRQQSPPNAAATAPAKPDGSAASNDKNQQSSASQVQDAVKSMNDFVDKLNSSSLKFSVDDDTGKTIVKVMDTETNEVIKQIPSEEMIEIAKAVDQLKGLLVQQKA